MAPSCSAAPKSKLPVSRGSALPGREDMERTDGGIAVISLTILSPFPSIHFSPSCISHHFLPAICHCSYPLPFPISPFSPLHCLPAPHPPLFTSPSPPASIFHPPLVFTRSPPCFLSPPDMGGFVEAERSQTVSQGEGALVHAPRIHSFPRPQITWFRDGRKIPSSSRM